MSAFSALLIPPGVAPVGSASSIAPSSAANAIKPASFSALASGDFACSAAIPEPKDCWLLSNAAVLAANSSLFIFAALLGAPIVGLTAAA